MSESNLPTLQLQTTNAINATPTLQTFSQYLSSALNGGDGTYHFFADQMGPAYRLSEHIAKSGGSAWRYLDDAAVLDYDFLVSGSPAYMAEAGGGALIIQMRMDEEALQTDSTELKQVGVSTIYFVTSEGPVDQIVSTIEKLGPAISVAAMLPLIKNLLSAFKRLCASYLTNSYEMAEAGAIDAADIASESAEVAAEDAAIEGEVIADEIALDMIFTPLAIAGIAIATVSILIAILLFFLSKTMTLLLKVYNYTNETLTLQICYKHDVETLQAPSSPDIPPVGIPAAPPGVTPLDPVVYRADYILQNNDSLEGIGIGLQGPSANLPNMAVMIDIPNAGDNSIWAGFQAPTGNCEHDIWDAHKNDHKQLTYGQKLNDSFTAFIATNQLSGKSPSPVTGDNGYYYEFVVILQESGVSL